MSPVAASVAQVAPTTGPYAAAGFWNFARQNPDQVALVESDGRSLTYGSLLGRVNQLSHALRARGFEPGTVLALAMPNRFEYYEVLLATAQIGVNVLTLSTHLTVGEAQYILTDSRARGLVVDTALHDVFAAAAAASAVGIDDRHIVTVASATDYADRIHRGAGQSPNVEYEDLLGSESTRDPDDRVAGTTLLYTSGTTGKPKGVRRLVGSAASPEEVYARHASAMVDRFDWKVGEGVYLLSGPLYHRASSAHSIYALMLGHTVVVVHRWDAEQALQLIERFAVSNSHMVPTMFHRLLSLPEQTRNRYDLTSLRSVVHAAAPCSVQEKLAMIQWWGPVIYEYYAATEGGGTAVGPRDWMEHPGTVGRAWAGAEVEIRDEACRERLGPDQVGTIWISLRGQDFEYINDPEKTRAGRVDGRFTVGDLGRMDADGWLYIVDRRADLIISGGVNIYPAEIESVLLTHPGIDEVAVIGVPDDEWGQLVKAFVKLRDGSSEGPGTEEALREHCARSLARYKCPRLYEFAPEIPRSEIGKVLKKALR